MNDIIYLLTEITTTDIYGNRHPSYERREVFAKARSVSQTEFYKAANSGLNPSYTFVLADFYDYNDEKFIEYMPWNKSEPVLYKVIRTYRAGNKLEIVCEEVVNDG